MVSWEKCLPSIPGLAVKSVPQFFAPPLPLPPRSPERTSLKLDGPIFRINTYNYHVHNNFENSQNISKSQNRF